jgi:hypothetical protein
MTGIGVAIAGTASVGTVVVVVVSTGTVVVGAAVVVVGGRVVVLVEVVVAGSVVVAARAIDVVADVDVVASSDDVLVTHTDGGPSARVAEHAASVTRPRVATSARRVLPRDPSRIGNPSRAAVATTLSARAARS